MEVESWTVWLKADVAEFSSDVNELDFTNISMLLRNVDNPKGPGSDFQLLFRSLLLL